MQRPESRGPDVIHDHVPAGAGSVRRTLSRGPAVCSQRGVVGLRDHQEQALPAEVSRCTERMNDDL